MLTAFFCTSGGLCGQVVNTLDLEVHGSSLAPRIVSLDKELYSTYQRYTVGGNPAMEKKKTKKKNNPAMD